MINKLLGVISLIGYIHCSFSIEVTVSQGKLAGNIYKSRNGTRFYGFLAVPYAKPPIGNLRFEPPQEPEAWDGIRQASAYSSICMQPDISTVNASKSKFYGNEDCLYLNVFTPSVDENEKFPVMVWIHGGGLTQGSGSLYSPVYLLDKPIVLVTINYRLGIFGFLSTSDKVIPGNNGLKDQVAALKWIQKNIKSFGGDPGKVTIFGESAGGASVHFHMYSPLSKGLFHRAISHSGSALSMWAKTPATLAREKATALGLLTGCPIKSNPDLLDCLKLVPAEEILSHQMKFYVWDFDPAMPFAVVQETNTNGAFLTENPWHHNIINKVPYIIGISSSEGAFKVSRFLMDNGKLAAELNANFQRLFPIIFNYGYLETRNFKEQVTDALKKYYFGDGQIGKNTSKGFVDLFTDSFFMYDNIEAALNYRNLSSDVYFYYYDHKNKNSYTQVFGATDELGVCHSDVVVSLFELPDLFSSPVQGNDLQVSKRLINRWVNFAYNGNPNPENEVIWKSLQSNNIEGIHIQTSQDKMQYNLLSLHQLRERYQFWKKFSIIMNQ